MPINPKLISPGLRSCLKLHTVVLICRHVSEDQVSANGFMWKSLPDRHGGGAKFVRDDGTEGVAEYAIACIPCSDNKSADFIEHWWDGERFHVSDFHRPPT